MAYEFKTPKFKKNFDNQKLDKQLPIPIEIFDETSNCYLEYYTAYFNDGKIFVKDYLQAEHLYKFGNFGKGEFSRGLLCLNTNKIDSQNDNNEYDTVLSIKNIPLMSNERYKRRKEWAEMVNNKNNNKKESFHDLFLEEFLKTRTKLLNLNDLDVKPKCKIELNEKFKCFDDENSIKINYDDDDNITVEVENNNNNLNKKQIIHPPNFDPFSYVIKDIPTCIVNEYSYLMYEEAFFLSYALGCLKIFNENDSKELNNTDLWKLFSKLDENFIYKYIVYHKLRSKGWVLKNGIKYACDFLAYYRGPEYYHASYSIVVKKIEKNSDYESLASFAGLVRLNENASKEIMICYVIFDDDDDDDQCNIDLNTPNCIKKSGVCEFIVNRWVPEQNRMEIKK